MIYFNMVALGRTQLSGRIATPPRAMGGSPPVWEFELEKADGTGTVTCITGERFSGTPPNFRALVTIDGNCCHSKLFRVERILAA